MKLVERVLHQISSEEISDIASLLNTSIPKIISFINSTIPGVLSAFKAKIVSSMNSGDMSPLIDLLNQETTHIDLNELFDDNQTALDTLYQRISVLNNISLEETTKIIETIMPTISIAITKMFYEFNSNTLAETLGDSYINQLITSDNGYEKAINDANQFLGSVFKQTLSPEQITEQSTSSQILEANFNENDYIQNLYDLFDQDNDGSVMDDIYKMLIR